MKFPSYPKYKDSGVEWLGEVPEHWEVKRGRFCMQVNPRTDKLRALGPDDEVSFVPMDAVGEYGGLRLDTTKPLADIGTGYTEFQNGDVIVAKITPCFENWKGALATNLFNGVAMGTTELHVLRALQYLDAQFLFYLTLSNGYRKTGEAEMYGAGGQKRVPPEFNKNFCTPLPPLLEQHAIAAFLDAQTAKIDTLIAKKRELIDKLKEKRAALITRTVTRGLPPEAAKAAGLDPNPRMKDSGVEWLGEMPEHWGVKRLDQLTDPKRQIMYGIVLPGPDYEGGVPIIKGGDVRPHRLHPDFLSRTNPQIDVSHAQSRLSTGDIIYSIRGSFGDVEFVPESLNNANMTQDVARISKYKETNMKWLLFVLSAECSRQQSVSRSVGATIKGVNIRDLKRIIIARPKAEEQQAIASFLDRETAMLDQMTTKVESAIERLQEYRSALITAAVTGKIDVRKE